MKKRIFICFIILAVCLLAGCCDYSSSGSLLGDNDLTTSAGALVVFGIGCLLFGLPRLALGSLAILLLIA